MATKAVLLLCILLVSLIVSHETNARELAHYSQNEGKSGKFMAAHDGDSKQYISYPIVGPGRPYGRPCKISLNCRRPPAP